MMDRRLGFALVIGLTFLTGVARSQDDDESSCIGCHIEQDDPYYTPAELFPTDVHAQAGFGCESCHGGDPEAWDYDEAKDPSTGFRGVPTGLQVIQVCGECHSNPNFMRRYNPNIATDQVAKYWTSGHGRSLREGNTEAAQCASCHTTHAIKRSTDPGSAVYHGNVARTCAKCHADPELIDKFELPANIVEQYKSSVHGVALLERGDVAAPTCNNCHGNHGAAPPEVDSIQEVCGNCHVNNQALFNQTKMKSLFTSRGLHGCAVCHTAHNIMPPGDEMIGVNMHGICSQCHQSGDFGAIESGQIRAVLDSLALRLREAEDAMRMAESRGLEIQDLLLDLQTAHTSQIQSRTMVHTFDADLVREAATPGMALGSKVLLEIDRLIKDFRMRKIGLGIATIFISFLALILYLYIRTLE